MVPHRSTEMTSTWNSYRLACPRLTTVEDGCPAMLKFFFPLYFL
uniref:Uncharacterized protein n=1 Tax=Arundo donax TaxID=35708 RepID=A0A0A9BI94_ARUDO